MSSGTDYRDRIASAAIPVPIKNLPPVFHTNLGDVMDQNKMPACVSHSIVYLMRLYWFRKTGKWIDFSPRFLDILSAETWIPLDGGRVPRTVLKLASSVGCCTTALLPNNTEFITIAEYRNPKVITQAMRDEAAKYRIPGFIRVATDPTSARNAIYQYGAVSNLFSIGEELWVPSWAKKDTDPLRTPQAIVSGHQMAPCGWTGPTLNSLRNQWSDQWANKGETEYDPIKWSSFIHESWAVADIPSDVKEFLSNLPSSADFHLSLMVDVHLGEYSTDIKLIQIAFMILGYLKITDPTELGYFGPKTAAANSLYQQLKKIFPTVPNSIGPQTRKALNADFAI